MTTATRSLQSDSLYPAAINRRVSPLYASDAEVCAVIEVGSINLRAGLSSEVSPRCVLRHRPSAVSLEENRNASSAKEHLVIMTEEWLGEAEDRIEETLREAVNRYLYFPLKGKRVVLVEHHFLPTRLKSSIARVLFTNHQAKELTFLHSGVCSMLGIGLPSGIVLDIGTRECIMTPIYDYRPLSMMVQSTRIAGSVLNARTRYLLRNFGNPRLDYITDDDLNEFASLALVCLPISPHGLSRATCIPDEELSEHYNLDIYRGETYVWKQPSTEIETHLPVWTRFAISEAFFEATDQYADPAYRSIAACISSVIKSVATDLRPHLSTLIITGGLCQIPGLQERIRQEAGMDVAENVHHANLSWTGASLATSLGYSGQSVNLQQFTSTGRVPDWSIPSRA